MAKQRVIVYIDGFNFYNGLRDMNWRNYYWLDINKFSQSIIKDLNKNHVLVESYYFSAPPHKHITKEKRQRRFFDVNEINNVKIIKGYHKDKSKDCNKCGKKMSMSEEKQTDVNIALWMLKNAAIKKCDLSILISGDTDMIPIIQSIKDISPNHKIMVFFPPKRKTHQMIKYLDGWRDLSKYEKYFKESLFSDQVNLSTDKVIEIPKKWKLYQ